MGSFQVDQAHAVSFRARWATQYTGNNEETVKIDVKHLQFSLKFPRDEIKSCRSWYIFKQIQMKDNNKSIFITYISNVIQNFSTSPACSENSFLFKLPFFGTDKAKGVPGLPEGISLSLKMNELLRASDS